MAKEYTVWSSRVEIDLTQPPPPATEVEDLPETPQEGDAAWRQRARARVWHHASPRGNRQSIMRQGLVPPGLGSEARGLMDGIHLSVDPLPGLAAFLHNVDDDQIDVYRVSLEGLPELDLTPGWDDMEEHMAVYCVIPPENLELVATSLAT